MGKNIKETTYVNATVGMQNHNGENHGLLNLSGTFNTQADATESVASFCKIVSKLTPEVKATLKFVPYTKEGKTMFRLVKPNNQTIGFVNSDTHNLTGWTLSDVTVEPYSQTSVTEADWENFLT